MAASRVRAASHSDEAGPTLSGDSVGPSAPIPEAGLRVRLMAADLTPSEVRLARLILADYPQSGLTTASALAIAAKTSQATVTRFASKLGYVSFPRFQDAVRAEVRRHLASPSTRLKLANRHSRGRPYQSLLDAIELDAENLRQTVALVEPNAFDALVDMLARADVRIFISGSKKADAVARYFAAQLNQLRPRVQMLSLNDALPDAIVDITDQDLLLVFEPRRATKQLANLVAAFRQAGATVAVVCDEYPAPGLARSSILVSAATRGTSLFDSYTAIVSIINGLIAAVVPRLPRVATARIDRLEGLNRDFGIWAEANELRGR